MTLANCLHESMQSPSVDVKLDFQGGVRSGDGFAFTRSQIDQCRALARGEGFVGPSLKTCWYWCRPRRECGSDACPQLVPEELDSSFVPSAVARSSIRAAF